MESQITGVSIVCSTVSTGADQRKHQSCASLGFVRRKHRWPVGSPHKGPEARNKFPFDDAIMLIAKRYVRQAYTTSYFGHIHSHTRLLVQWNLSVTTTFIIEFITCDLFSNHGVFMKTEGINLLLLTISAFWSSFRWPPRWVPEGREVSHYVVVIDRYHCIWNVNCARETELIFSNELTFLKSSGMFSSIKFLIPGGN